ncbi:MAG: hypothetical protein Q9206_006456 [Seirophora lacunosa]
MKQKLSEDGQEATTQRRMLMENGHPGVEVDEAAIRRGENPYTKYYQQQGEQQLPSDTQITQGVVSVALGYFGDGLSENAISKPVSAKEGNPKNLQRQLLRSLIGSLRRQNTAGAI